MGAQVPYEESLSKYILTTQKLGNSTKHHTATNNPAPRKPYNLAY